MNLLQKLFGKKEQPKKEDKKNSYKSMASYSQSTRRINDDYQNSLANPANPLSPLSPISPLNPFNQMNYDSGRPSHYHSSPAPDYTPPSHDSGSSHSGSSYSSDSSSYDSGSSSSDSSSVDSSGSW